MVYKLLLSDDSITMQKLVELILAEEGFEIMSTSNGEEALAGIPSFQPDIVLADVEMPKINGYQLCDKIKQNTSTSRLPVILLAGAFEQFDEELAKKVGADDFIIKPFESQELIGKVHAALAISAVTKEESVASPSIKEKTPEEDLWAMEEILETAGAKTETDAGVKEEIVLEEAVQPVTEETELAEVKIVEVELPSKDELKEIFEKNVRDKIDTSLSSFNIQESLVNSYMPQLKDSFIDIKEGILASIIPSIKDSVEKIVGETASDLTEGVLRDSMKVALESLLNRAEKEIINIIPELTERILSDTLRTSLDPVIKETEKAINETLPDLLEKMIRDELSSIFESLTKEMEKVVWKTVPDLAEAIILKEIERIRSEF
ncbi:MAG TPA: response regulator [Thermodesulfovibrionales bacterium]|nr:response regulator [Thermodesulfovibrionales bacterium]